MHDKYLTSQELRQFVKKRVIVSKLNEERIQPSSFEPTLGDEAYIIPKLFRPSENKTIFESIMDYSERKRIKADISRGYELKKGFTYLIPLQEKINAKEWSIIKSSPKSSLGRLFVNTRCVFDYNSCFDHISMHENLKNKSLNMWLVVQPLKFNIIVHPGITMNQLRFTQGFGMPMHPKSIIKEHEKECLIQIKDYGKCKIRFINDAVRVNLDLANDYTNQIIGFRAKNNPEPIDLRKIKEYNVLDYFDPIKSNNKKAQLAPKECYLFVTKEWLNVPSHLAFELKFNSPHLLRGDLHFAGFIDNGFNGNLVLEVISHENTIIELEDNMPIGEILVYETDIPDKIYGKAIGSSYKHQRGPRIAKYFKDVDYSNLQ